MNSIVFNDLFENVKENVSVINFNGIDISVRRNISAESMVAFVNNVVSTAFSGDGSFYCPEYSDIAKEVYTIACYTNVDLSGVDPSDIYNASIMGGLHDLILSVIDMEQYNNIMICADNKIKQLIETNSFEIKKDLENIASAFSSMRDMITNSIGDIDPESMKNAISAIGKINDIKESDIANAIAESMMQEKKE